MTTPELTAWIRKNPVLVGALALSVVLAAASFLRSGLAEERNAELDRKTAEARRYAINIVNAVQLKEQLAELTTANKAIADKLIHASELGINQQYFYKLENETGVKLLEITQSTRPGTTPKKGTDVMPVTFSISTEGDFASTMAFLRALQYGPHFCRVLDGSVSSGRSGPVNVTMSVDLLGQP